MAYVPPSDVPSAFLISTDAHAVLLDLLGTFVLLDGGAEKVSFTKHLRQIDANVITLQGLLSLMLINRTSMYMEQLRSECRKFMEEDVQATSRLLLHDHRVIEDASELAKEFKNLRSQILILKDEDIQECAVENW
ncbi:hypothetical protein Aduo_004988 [Ancylostoma duodenale]